MCVFAVGYIIIAFEHQLDLHKSLSAAALGGATWLLIALFGDHEAIDHSIKEGGAEIFGLILFNYGYDAYCDISSLPIF